MSVAVRGNVPGKWGPRVASHLTQRLQALEKAIVQSGGDVFVAPAIPSFGSGAITGGAGAGSAPSSGTTTTIIERESPTYARTFLLMGA